MDTLHCFDTKCIQWPLLLIFMDTCLSQCSPPVTLCVTTAILQTFRYSAQNSSLQNWTTFRSLLMERCSIQQTNEYTWNKTDYSHCLQKLCSVLCFVLFVCSLVTNYTKVVQNSMCIEMCMCDVVVAEDIFHLQFFTITNNFKHCKMHMLCVAVSSIFT